MKKIIKVCGCEGYNFGEHGRNCKLKAKKTLVSKKKEWLSGKLVKMFIPFEYQGDCRGENVWVKIIGVRMTKEFGFLLKAKLKNNPVSKEEFGIKYDDTVYAIRKIMPYERWVWLKTIKTLSN